MPLYQVLGLRTFVRKDITYQVDRAGFIMKDEQGKSLVEPYGFTHYVLYIQDKTDDALYSIELFDTVGASFGKRSRICRYGHMHVSPIKKTDVCLKYQPLKELVFEYNFRVGMYDFDDDIDIYEYNAEDPASQRIFTFSTNAGDERVPDGFVLVNMDYFYEIPVEIGCDLSWNLCG